MKKQFTLWLEHEALSADNVWDFEDECINASITLADGRCYAVTIWTYKNVATQISFAQKDGSGLNGKYLTGPDLLVERIDRPTLESVFTELVENGGLRPEWEVISDDQRIRVNESISWNEEGLCLSEVLAFLGHHDRIGSNNELAELIQITRERSLDLKGLKTSGFNEMMHAILDFYSRFEELSFSKLSACTTLVVLLSEDCRVSCATKSRATELLSKFRSTFKTKIARRERRLARRKDIQKKDFGES